MAGQENLAGIVAWGLAGGHAQHALTGAWAVVGAVSGSLGGLEMKKALPGITRQRLFIVLAAATRHRVRACRLLASASK